MISEENESQDTQQKQHEYCQEGFPAGPGRNFFECFKDSRGVRIINIFDIVRNFQVLDLIGNCCYGSENRLNEK